MLWFICFKYIKTDKYRIIALIFIIVLWFYLINIFLKKINKKSIENFENSIQIYYINLKDSYDRNKKMIEQCTNLSCNRINAINGKTFDINDVDVKIKNSSLSRNCIACFLSHINSLKSVLKNNESYAIILEDDVLLDNNLITKLSIIRKELPHDFDILFLGGTRVCGKKYSKNLIKQKQINKDCNAGAFAYLVSNKSCRKILELIYKDGIYKMYDHQLRDYFPKLNVFYTSPMLVNHNYDFESDRIKRKYTENYINNSSTILVE